MEDTNQNEAAVQEQQQAPETAEAKPKDEPREGEINGLRVQLEKAKAELKRRDDEAEKRRMQKLEEQNKLKELLEEKEKKYAAEIAEREQRLAAMEREGLRRDLEIELIGAGMDKERDAFSIKGITAEFLAKSEKERGSAAEFLESLKKTAPHLFEKKKTAQPPATGGIPAASGAKKVGILDPRFRV